MRVGLAGPRIDGLHGNRTHRAMHGLIERDEEVALDVAAAPGATRPAVRGEFLFPGRETIIPPARAAKKLLEEIAEASSLEMKFLPRRAVGPMPRARPATGRRLISAAVLPVRPQLVVLLALDRIAQDFVRLVDLLEFLLGRLFVLGDVRMIF